VDLRDFLQEAFSEIWVAGEVNRVRASQSGHLYFELVEKGEDDQIVGKLEAVAWRSDHQRIRQQLASAGLEITEGQTIRCRGGVDFYPPFGRLQLVVKQVDPIFTAGLLARRRQEVLESLAARGLLELNRQKPLPELPLRVALITSDGSAAYHDFLSSLEESGYGFEVHFIHASVQGSAAEREVSSAFRMLQALPIDCAVLIRGGGSRADLAVFDSRRISEAVALAPVPVLTGLGHEIDEAIADRVAYAAFKTPTKVAEFLVERVALEERRLADLRRALTRSASQPLRRGRESLGRAQRGLSLVRHRLLAAASKLGRLSEVLPRAARWSLDGRSRRLEELRRRLRESGQRRLAEARREPVLVGERIAAQAEASLRERKAVVEGWQRLCRQLSPRQTLVRGFSITRDSRGNLLRHPRQVAAGEKIISQLAGGDLVSQVEES
jgi:exodeoxyribonuclease VII large subunit